MKEELLDDFVISAYDEPALNIVAWWEKRRWYYNLFVGGIGFLGLIFFSLFHSLFEEIPFLVIITYGLMANVFYTGGWVAEILIRIYFKSWILTENARKLIFIVGTVCSVLLTLIILFIVGLVADY